MSIAGISSVGASFLHAFRDIFPGYETEAMGVRRAAAVIAQDKIVVIGDACRPISVVSRIRHVWFFDDLSVNVHWTIAYLDGLPRQRDYTTDILVSRVSRRMVKDDVLTLGFGIPKTRNVNGLTISDRRFHSCSV